MVRTDCYFENLVFLYTQIGYVIFLIRLDETSGRIPFLRFSTLVTRKFFFFTSDLQMYQKFFFLPTLLFGCNRILVETPILTILPVLQGLLSVMSFEVFPSLIQESFTPNLLDFLLINSDVIYNSPETLQTTFKRKIHKKRRERICLTVNIQIIVGVVCIRNVFNYCKEHRRFPHQDYTTRTILIKILLLLIQDSLLESLRGYILRTVIIVYLEY